MADAEIQYVCDDQGEATAVIVPIALWREIESERETVYLLNSEAMKRRLLEAKETENSRLALGSRLADFVPLDSVGASLPEVARGRVSKHEGMVA